MADYPYAIQIDKSMRIGQTILYREEVASTNDELKKLARKGEPDGTVLFAYAQNQGRGRMGRSWASAGGKGIYMSLLLRPDRALKASYAASLSLVLGLACAEAIESATLLPADIKWPNDILVNGRKVCGILMETSIDGSQVNYVIAGIGVNANNDCADFPEEFRRHATSLSQELGQTLSTEKLAGHLLHAIDKHYQAFMAGDLQGIITAYKDKCLTLHKRVSVAIGGQNTLAGVAADISPEGHLILNTDSGEKTVICAGEASVRTLDGRYA